MRCYTPHQAYVADALVAAGLPLPADYIKRNTSNRNGTPCMRSTQQPAVLSGSGL